MYADWFFAGAPKDAITLIKRVVSDGPVGGLAQFVVGKAGPLVGIIGGEAFNKDGTGRPIYNREDDTVDQSIDQGKFIAGKFVPITVTDPVKAVYQALTDPDKEYSYSDILDIAAGAIGAKTIHEGGSGSGKKFSTSSKPAGNKEFTIRGK